MSEQMGMIEYGENREEGFLARDIAQATRKTAFFSKLLRAVSQ